MKKLHFIFLLFIVLGGLLQGCLKDTLTATYTSYEPVYKSKQEVLAAVKGGEARPLRNTGKLVLYGNYLLVNELNEGVHIIDNSNPAVPVNTAFVSIPGNVDIAIKNNILYADIFTDLLAIDISNPLQATLQKVIWNVFPERQYASGFSNDTSRYIVDWIKHETTVKSEIDQYLEFERSGDWLFTGGIPLASAAPGGLSNAAASVIGITGSMARFTIIGQYLYTVGQTSLTAFNISTPANPVSEHTTMVGWNIETIYPLKDKLFIGGQTGMFIYSVQQPAVPQALGSFSHACFNDPVVANDTHAYITLRAMTQPQGGALTVMPCWGATPQRNELDIVDITDLLNPALVKIYDMEEPMGLSLDNNLLFLCDGKGGLKLYDVTDVQNIRLIRQVNGVYPFDVIAWQGRAIVVSKEGVLQYAYSPDGSLQQISLIPVQP